MAKILVSACLLGCATRYDGLPKPAENVLRLAEDNVLIPVCPEQMGGLPTPRTPSERIPGGRRVLAADGRDVTAFYQRGAEMTLKIAELNRVDYCILKSGSPSCGKGQIYDGTFSGQKISGNGLTAETLLHAGFPVYTEKEL